jgi:hypothetical protein
MEQDCAKLAWKRISSWAVPCVAALAVAVYGWCASDAPAWQQACLHHLVKLYILSVQFMSCYGARRCPARRAARTDAVYKLQRGTHTSALHALATPEKRINARNCRRYSQSVSQAKLYVRRGALGKLLLEQCPTLHRPYWPAPLAFSAHLQTVLTGTPPLL